MLELFGSHQSRYWADRDHTSGGRRHRISVRCGYQCSTAISRHAEMAVRIAATADSDQARPRGVLRDALDGDTGRVAVGRQRVANTEGVHVQPLSGFRGCAAGRIEPIGSAPQLPGMSTYNSWMRRAGASVLACAALLVGCGVAPAAGHGSDKTLTP